VTRLDGADPLDQVRHGLRQGGATHPLDRLLACDTGTYLPGDLLVKVDRMTMAHSLEGRSPLLDHHVMEFAASLPADLKLRGRTSKYLLKKAAAELLPPEILGRKKQGFGVPIGRWLRGPLRGWLNEVLGSPAAHARGYFEPRAVDGLIAEHAAGRVDHSQRLWALAMLELWHLMFVDKTLSPPSCAKVTLP
jgi:asparagine synthase (glutamine-hydrolysing)